MELTMSLPPSIDALRSALDPVEALRGEQSALETWVRESFAALEALHDELGQWQADLTRQQAEMDGKRADCACTAAAAGNSAGGDNGFAPQETELQTQLQQAREETRQLEEENAEQLQAMDDLERQLVAVQAELRTARKQAEELSDDLAAERKRTAEERHEWMAELREFRQAVERQGDMLISLGAAFPGGDGSPEFQGCSVDGQDGNAASSTDSAARAAELRRRATSRRAIRRTT